MAGRPPKMSPPVKPTLFALSLAVLSVTSPNANASTVDPAATDHAQIQQLIEHFKAAIRGHDGDTLRGLFFPGGSWLQGLDQASLAAVRSKDATATQFSTSHYQQFVKFVGTASQPIEEVFDNVRIDTDGTVGMVFFDYRFLEGGKQTNHGVETWQLVHTDQGWKISAMLYSVILDDIH
jgi:hypothetical protein